MSGETAVLLWGGPALGLYLLLEALVGALPRDQKRIIHACAQGAWAVTSLTLWSFA